MLPSPPRFALDPYCSEGRIEAQKRGGGGVGGRVSCSGLAVKCFNAHRVFFSFQDLKWTLSEIRFRWALKMSDIQPIHSSYLKFMELKIILIFS